MKRQSATNVQTEGSIRPRIYLAGPTVFMHDAAERGTLLKAICEEYGCRGIFPGDVTAVGRGARGVYDTCMTALSNAQAVVADLSPFRGPHVDDGTAFEIGVAKARGLPIFGYASDLRPLTERIERHPRAAALVDDNGIAIENLGEPFNAMIAAALKVPAFPTSEEAIAAASRFLRASRVRTDAEVRTAMVQMRHETFGTTPPPADLTRRAIWAALGRVRYSDMSADALADHLANELGDRGVTSDENSYAGGLQTAIASMESIRLPFLATILRPTWLRDFDEVLHGLQRSSNMLRDGDAPQARATLRPPRQSKLGLWLTGAIVLACALLAARTSGLLGRF